MTTLLNEVKSYLRITWNEEDGNISNMINRAVSYLNEKAGVTIDFDLDQLARQLLLDRCRYVYNHVPEEFEDNFLSDINSLQLRYVEVEVETDVMS